MLAPEQPTLRIAIDYIRRGWALVRIELRSKAPKEKGWPSLRITEAEAHQYFSRPYNIGVILGQASGGLCDGDLDCPEAIELAPRILPATNSRFGRASKLESHWLYRIVDGELLTKKFVDPLTGEMIVELRCDGGSQTVFPGSVHEEGEKIEWAIDGPPAEIDGDTLLKRFAKLAAVSLVRRYCAKIINEEMLLKALENGRDLSDAEYASLTQVIKEAVRQKQLDNNVGGQILLWLDYSPAKPFHNKTSATAPPLAPQPTHLIGRQIKTLNLDHLNPKFRAEPILAGCAQMQRLRDDAANQSRDSWWHCLGTLAFCEGGDPIAHELSSGHPKYSFEETQRELDGWRAKADGASLCETFDRKSPGICGRCPHRGKLNSPIVLGINQPVIEPSTPMANGAVPPSAGLFQAPAALSLAQKQKELGPKEKLLRIGFSAELWHDRDRVAFATILNQGRRENYMVKSQAFRDRLLDEYGTRHRFTIDSESHPHAPGEQHIKDAVSSFVAKARSGAEHQPAIRTAKDGERIFVDLGTPDWSAVEISVDGWRIISEPPVRFLRPAGLLPMPAPTPGGDIHELKNFLNVRDDEFVLAVSWLLAALRPTGPYPILIVNGEHGSGKSVFCRLLRRLTDPNSAALRSYPRDERDLFLAAKNGWVLALDNLSGLKGDLSDMLCRIATKAALGTRRLYSDDEELLIEVWRPILLNGIPPLASRADLASRSIVLSLRAMPESRRRSEREFWSSFDEAAPRLLGALFDGVSGAMRNLHSVDLRTRMMDFANWAEAGWRALGLQAGVFDEIYAQNAAQAAEDALDADSVALAILKLCESKPAWTGTATELLSALGSCAPPGERDRYWPKDATRLRGHLNRLSPLLRPRGIEIEFGRAPDAGRKRLVTIKKVAEK
jgi:hypothetical protein